ncbi:CGNR zinc finger domain-containing protein [Streptomyces sp. NPDC055186]
MAPDSPSASLTDLPPLNGEPLPLEFANTVYPVRGALMDTFRTPEHLAWWLRSCADRLPVKLPDAALAHVSPVDIRCFTLLRDATRRLIDAYVGRGEPDPWDVANLNRAAGMDRPLPLLQWPTGGRPSAVDVTTTPPLLTVQAVIAQSVVGLLAGTTGVEPRPCTAPGCVFFFNHARSRREWCSAGCGNRARAARHYARHREDRSGGSGSHSRHA